MKSALYQKRFNWIREYTFENLIQNVIDDMIADVAKEAFNEGRIAKYAAERHSGLYFPNPVWMQFATYNALAKLWKQRKEELILKSEMNLGMAGKVEKENEKKELTDEEIMRVKVIKRMKRAEKKRQQRLCDEMTREEQICRAFYQWEMKENLRERREMREEDSAARAIRKEEERMKKAGQSAYAVSESIAQNSMQSAQVTDFEKRRLELKDLTMERRRRAEEQAYMVLEDKFGEKLREIDRIERQRLQFIKEFGEVEDEEEEENSNVDGAPYGEVKMSKVKIPWWMEKPRKWDEWTVAQKRTHVEFMSKMRMRMKTIEKKARREMKLLKKLEDKSFKEWEQINSFYSQKELKSEIQLMQDEEDLKAAEAEVIYLNDNIRKISIYCREKGEEELKAITEIKKCEENARRRDKELEEATAWLQLCERRAKHRDKLKRKITEDCKWIDSDSITGFLQRFKTELLRERLYREYFLKIVASIINRAESIATERKLMSVQELLSMNREQIKAKTQGMKKQWHSFQRHEYMRMKRSFLNQKFFPKMRREILRERFTGWVRFYLWNRGHREAFEMKYEIIKRQLDIDRQFRNQLIKSKEDSTVREKGTGTLMRKNRERSVQCHLCRLFYLEAQNNALSCVFHPEKYSLGCPKTCPNPGLSALCISHRMRRWKCCDSTRENAPGCSRRHHIPVASDPIYDKIMMKINERDAEYMQDIDKKHALAMKEDWPGKLVQTRVDQVKAVEDKIHEAREIVERFNHLKFH